jgi:hypothetical protein
MSQTERRIKNRFASDTCLYYITDYDHTKQSMTVPQAQANVNTAEVAESGRQNYGFDRKDLR